MNDGFEPQEEGAVARTARRVVPWVALAVILWVLMGFVSQFRQTSAELAAVQAAQEASATAAAQASAVTTVTGVTATVRSDMPLRSQPDTSTTVVATAKSGSVLLVEAKKTTWLRVKDASGRVGWIPNDIKYVVIKTK